MILKTKTVTKPEKLRFVLSITFNNAVTGDELRLKKKFVEEMRSRAPSWLITCTNFMMDLKRVTIDGYYYHLSIELIAQPRKENAKPLVFMEKLSVMPSYQLLEVEPISFEDVLAASIMPPVSVEFFSEESADYVPSSPIADEPATDDTTVPVSEEKKDEKKAFPWWIVIVIGVVVLFFIMKD